MDREKLKNETFLGLVIDNNDPKKLGRCKIKVFQVFDKFENEDVPWALPWKDLNGNQFAVPDIGKYVSVVFDQGNKYAPEYIYAQNFNINLENKLQSLSGEDYTSMRAVMFDHSTQIYRNSSEGLKIDHEYSNINLDPFGNILLNLRDNNSVLTLGSKDSNQRVVLGDSFFDWFDGLIENLLGQNGGAFISSDGSPVTASPRLVEVLMNFNRIREDLLSSHVKLPRNGNVIAQTRQYVNQRGDGDFSTILPATPQPVSVTYDNLTTGNLYNNSSSGNPAEQNQLTGSDTEQEGTGSDILDPSRVGASTYIYSAVAKSLKSKGYANGSLDVSILKPVQGGNSLARYGYKYLLHPIAADKFLNMKQAAKKAGFDLVLSSAYRDLAHQRSLGSSKGVAKVGGSAHGWGGAIDFGYLFGLAGGSPNPGPNRRVRETDSFYKWLSQNGPTYGWYNPYRLRDNSGTDECWHFEYWGDV